jgi:hypothetical protein
MLEVCNLTMKSKNNPAGTLTVSHYMTILQKLTSLSLHNYIKSLFRLGDDYDFDVDEANTKLKANQDVIRESLLKRVSDTKTGATQFLRNNFQYIYNNDIPSIVKYINDVSGGGEKVITLTKKTGSTEGKNTYFYEVVDRDLAKQLQKRAAKASAVEKRGTYTATDIYDKRLKHAAKPKIVLVTPIRKRNITEPFKGVEYKGKSDINPQVWVSPHRPWGEGEGFVKEREEEGEGEGVIASSSSSSSSSGGDF